MRSNITFQCQPASGGSRPSAWTPTCSTSHMKGELLCVTLLAFWYDVDKLHSTLVHCMVCTRVHRLHLHGCSYSRVWHSVAAQRSGTARHGTARHGTAQHGTAQHGTARHGTARHGTARHGTAQHSTAQHSTAQHHTSLTQLVLANSISLYCAACLRLPNEPLLPTLVSPAGAEMKPCSPLHSSPVQHGIWIGNTSPPCNQHGGWTY